MGGAKRKWSARTELSQFEVTPTQFVCEEDEVERMAAIFLLIFLPDKGEQPGLHHGAEDVAPPAVIWLGKLSAEQQQLVDHQVEGEVEEEEIQKEAPGGNGIKKVK